MDTIEVLIAKQVRVFFKVLALNETVKLIFENLLLALPHHDTYLMSNPLPR